MKEKTERNTKGGGAFASPLKEKGEKRDIKGRFQKGHKGTGGRPKGTIKDILGKDGQKRSVATLIDDLLGAYTTMGGGKFLAKWATQNHRNLSKFIDILYKFAPMPETPSMAEGVSYELSDKFMPKFDVPRPGDDLDKRFRDLEDSLKEKDREIERLRGVFDTHGIDSDELVHEPIPPIELPEHGEVEMQEKIEELEKRKAELEAEIKEKS